MKCTQRPLRENKPGSIYMQVNLKWVLLQSRMSAKISQSLIAKHFSNTLLTKLPPLSRIRDYINDIIFIFILWAEVDMIAPQVSYILIDNHI